MNPRILVQASAILASFTLVVTLTLAIMGKLSDMVFWLTALACFILVMLFKKE